MKAFKILLLYLAFGLPVLGQRGVMEGGVRRLLEMKVDSIVSLYLASDLIPGAVVQIKQKGRIIISKSYGLGQKYDFHHRKIDPPDTMSTNTLFDIASLTKVVGTTTAIMLLSEHGIISVDAPVFKYIPEFNTDEKRAITIRHLLTHSAGLVEWYPMYFSCSNKQEVYTLISKLPLKYPIGAGRHYSDLGFTLLGEIVEKVSGMTLEDYFHTHIFLPLGMEHTVFNPLQKSSDWRIAATSLGNPYERRMVSDSSLGFVVRGLDTTGWKGWRLYTLKGEVNDGNAWYACGGVCGAAGLFSCVSDLQKLVDMLVAEGMVGRKIFLQAKTIKQFLSKDSLKNGMGWMMDPVNEFMKNAAEGTFGHTGFTGTSIAVVPKRDLSIIILINRQNCGLQKNGEYFNVNPIRHAIFQLAMDALP